MAPPAPELTPTCTPRSDPAPHIGAELGVPWSTVSQQLHHACITMRRGALAHPASTKEILELRERGLTLHEVAKRVDITVSGAWSRYRKARLPGPVIGPMAAGSLRRPRRAPAIRVRAAVADRPGRTPTRAETHRCTTSRPQSRSPGSCPRTSGASR